MARKTSKKRKSADKNSHLKRLNYALAGLALCAIFGLGYYSYTQLLPTRDSINEINSKNDTKDTQQISQNGKKEVIIGKPLEPIKHKKYEFDKNENLSQIFFKNNKNEKTEQAKSENSEKNTNLSPDLSKTQENQNQEAKNKSQVNSKQNEKKEQIDRLQIEKNEVKKEITEKEQNKKTEKSIEKTPKIYPNYTKPPKQFLPGSKKAQPTIHLANKPRLVIIIDDIATKAHAAMVRSIGLKITPSIFPPTSAHPDTPRIADEFSSFMIHLPLEAIKFNKPEPNTLKDSDSYEHISSILKKVRKDFPKAKYINNHTGSKFTSSEQAMIKLLRASLIYDFTFLDSRTTQYSKVASASEKLGLGYIGRDVFLDDDEAANEVKKELEKAVSMAKKRGYAIAIGHPKPNTINTIKAQKNGLLKDVDVVYFSELYH
ncbi:divergent polysaccharide deacetylase family protein [Campylobacter sp. 19-13652]|uniref:divergent polysaccharide deacetylase family protein n=1 Tax=Campylobacter sp. 19-13652 TaxID=2840180 RepID=UPI001C74D371|nr:divergent polysaccharide deacetylase family protein [Campylobacter sp. 19-13652]BCX79506.1 hypothetical protein LBC_09680 [Campylobacter sp. 19-13652]